MALQRTLMIARAAGTDTVILRAMHSADAIADALTRLECPYRRVTLTSSHPLLAELLGDGILVLDGLEEFLTHHPRGIISQMLEATNSIVILALNDDSVLERYGADLASRARVEVEL